MDHPQYSTLLDALAAIPDPRHARGKQLEWSFILGVIASALPQPATQCGSDGTVGARACRIPGGCLPSAPTACAQ